MALYVAIFDIHPGDRKHFERLLGRISDKRSTESDILYIESYGSMDALLKTPQKYDLIILDSSLEFDYNKSNLDLSSVLRNVGVSAPIAIYSPENTVPTTENLLIAKSLGNIFFYNKSIKNDDLLSMISTAKKLQSLKSPRIELRDAKNTYFVLPEEILYAQMVNSIMNVYLFDGSCVRIIKDITEFMLDLNGYNRYIQVGKDKIINLEHVKNKSSLAFEMDNGKKISFSIFEAGKIAHLYEKYKTITKM